MSNSTGTKRKKRNKLLVTHSTYEGNKLTVTKEYLLPFNSDEVRELWKRGEKVTVIAKKYQISAKTVSTICGYRMERHDYEDEEIIDKIIDLVEKDKTDREIIDELRREGIKMTMYKLKGFYKKINELANEKETSEVEE